MPTDAPEPASADDLAAPDLPDVPDLPDLPDVPAASGGASGGTAPPEPAGPPGIAGPSDGAGPGSEAGARSGLSARDEAVLAMERRAWPGPGAKERAIREQLALSPTRYYQLLSALLDDPAALAHDPVTVNRLRRLRQVHRDAR